MQLNSSLKDGRRTIPLCSTRNYLFPITLPQTAFFFPLYGARGGRENNIYRIIYVYIEDRLRYSV